MSNLSKRVEKSKSLVFSHNPHEPGRYSTWGSKDEEYGQKYYRVKLAHEMEHINTPDGKREIPVFLVSCQKQTGSVKFDPCPGNCRHTVCYHGLGAIFQSFRDAKKKKLISFFESYESASRMNFGGYVAKVKSTDGDGYLWATVKDWPEDKILSSQENINLMRGLESDEGID